MNHFRFFVLSSCCLLIPCSIFAQNADEKVIRIADLPDTIDQAKTDSYLNAVEGEIGKLVKDYSQLSSWLVKNNWKKLWDAGKLRTADSLTYAKGMKETNSNKYLDLFGTRSLYIRIKIVSQRNFAFISGAGAGSIAHGGSVAGGCLIAQITSANPRNDKLEEKLKSIIERGTSRKNCY